MVIMDPLSINFVAKGQDFNGKKESKAEIQEQSVCTQVKQEVNTRTFTDVGVLWIQLLRAFISFYLGVFRSLLGAHLNVLLHIPKKKKKSMYEKSNTVQYPSVLGVISVAG